MRRLRTLMRQPWSRQRLVAEAFGGLVHAWALVRFRRFPAYAARLGEPLPGEVRPDRQADPAPLRDVSWAIGSVNRTFGGRFTCLMEAMACKAMLNRRGVDNALVLGAKLNDRAGPAEDPMAAHAWLWAGGRVLVGGRERAGFVALTSYLSRN
jgi:hypothetical protein